MDQQKSIVKPKKQTGGVSIQEGRTIEKLKVANFQKSYNSSTSQFKPYKYPNVVPMTSASQRVQVQYSSRPTVPRYQQPLSPITNKAVSERTSPRIDPFVLGKYRGRSNGYKLSTGKKLNLYKYRDYKTRPLYKLTATLVSLYIKINETYSSLQQSKQKKRQHQDRQQQQQRQSCDDQNDDYIIRIGEVWNDKFKITRVLGRGSFGQVVEALPLSSNMMAVSKPVAIKIIRNRKSFFNQAYQEVKILEILNTNDPDNTKNIVQYRGSFIFKSHFCIIYEVLNQNLYQLLHATSFAGLNLKLIRKFSNQLLTSLTYLGENNIIHCDLKPENILLADKWNGKAQPNIKLVDFGSSCFTNERTFSYIQSRFYRSPEILMGHQYSPAIDIWSVGCILIELLQGDPLFPGSSEHDLMCRIVDVLGMPSESQLQTGKPSKINKLFTHSESDGWLIIPSKSYKPNNHHHHYLSQIVYKKYEATQNDIIHTINYNIQQQQQQNSTISSTFINDCTGTTRSDYARFIDLVEQMLKLNPLERITAANALHHKFFIQTKDFGVNTDFTQDGGREFFNQHGESCVKQQDNGNGGNDKYSSSIASSCGFWERGSEGKSVAVQSFYHHGAAVFQESDK